MTFGNNLTSPETMIALTIENDNWSEPMITVTRWPRIARAVAKYTGWDLIRVGWFLADYAAYSPRDRNHGHLSQNVLLRESLKNR